MEQTLRTNTQEDLVEPSVPGVSWAAVLAGAAASLALHRWCFCLSGLAWDFRSFRRGRFSVTATTSKSERASISL